METEPSIKQVGIKYGILTGLILTVYSLILQVSGEAANQAMGYISYALLIGGMVLAHNNYKETGDGFMTYGQGLGIGTIISAVAGFIGSAFSYIYIKFIDDSIIGTVIEQTREKLEEDGMDDEIIDQALAMTEKFLTPGWMFFFGFLGMLMFCFILILIVTAFTKKNKNELQE